jgi:multidrug efflux pump subunit AcrA (membrane-fusion protein)
MGLIRKSLMLSTAGVVSGSSKKQRLAKASLQELKKQTKLLAQIADPQAAARERAEQGAALARQQARIKASQEAKQQRAIERRARRLAKRSATPQAARQRAKICAPWYAVALHLWGWAVVIFFVFGAIGAAIAGSLIGVLGCAAVASAIGYPLYRYRDVLILRSTAEVPASQAPIQ